MARALLIIDVQNDFTEGGALGVDGGAQVARGISRLLAEHPQRYDLVVASRDWHHGDDDNGGHFASQDAAPDFVTTWPVHCVAGTIGADYHPDVNVDAIDVHVKKGQGRPAYSLYEGTTDDGRSVTEVLNAAGVDAVDVAGIATDFCVLASALDALHDGRAVRVLTDLVAGVAEDSSARALERLSAAGATLVASRHIDP